MTPTSAGSQSKEKGFLDNYIEDLKKERIPKDGDRALRGEVGDDVSGKMDRGVLKVWNGWPEEGKALGKRAHEVQQAEENPRACDQEPCGQGL